MQDTILYGFHAQNFMVYGYGYLTMVRIFLILRVDLHSEELTFWVLLQEQKMT